MAAGFEAYDDAGKLQFSSDVSAYTVVSTGSVSVTNVGGSFGRVIISLSNTTDMVLFRSSDCIDLSGFRKPTTYTIYTQSLSGTIQYKIIRPFNAFAASIDSMGLQLFSASGELLYSALQSTVYIADSVTAYGENGLGDVGAAITTGTGTNPYALVIGNEFIHYNGDAGIDSYDRMLAINTTSSGITITSPNRNDWPGMPGGGGVYYPGTFSVAAVI